MKGPHLTRLALLATLFLVSAGISTAGDGEVVSSMRNVNAVAEAQGFRINPVYEMDAEENPGDLAPVQSFELVRPDGQPVTLGRLYTSCSCIQLEAPKRTFEPGERAILQLRNITPTPFNGQVYAFYVQVTSPVRATLRYDTFVQSRTIVSPPDGPEAGSLAAAPEEGDLAMAGEAAGNAAPVDLIVPESADATTPAEPELAAAATDGVADVDAARQEMDAYFADADQAGKAADAAASTDTTGTDVSSAGSVAAAPDEPAPLPPPEDLLAADAGEDEPVATTAPVESVETAAAPEVAVAAAPAVSTEPEVVAPPPEPAAPPAPADEPAPAVAAAPSGEPEPVIAAVPAEAAAEPRKPLKMVSLITIGVSDMARSVRFYEELGWRRVARNKYDQTAFFQLNSQVLALYPLSDLLAEQNMEGAKPSPGGITLAVHVSRKDDVRLAYDNFMTAGGVSLKEPTEMPSGAVTCYVADPDGNPWEISWVPQFRVDEEGGLWLP